MKISDFKRPDGKNLQIEIIKYHPADISRNKTPNRHQHNFHSIFFIDEGESTQEVDFDDFILKKQHLLLIPKDSVHWEKENRQVAGYTIMFMDDFFSTYQNRLLHGLLYYALIHRKLLISIPDTHLKSILYYFDLLFLEQTNDNKNQIFILQNLLLALLNHLEGLIMESLQMPSFLEFQSPFQRFIELVESSYIEQKELSFYVEKLGITTKNLNKIVKQITGKTPSQIILERTILEAKRQLSFNEKSIKEIAFSLVGLSLKKINT